jgi:predicted N-formylglutamate amidohydrolase
MNDMTLISPGIPAVSPLLDPADPSPVQLLNPHGRVPLLLVCDHAGNAIPKPLNQLGLGSQELAQHIAWDRGAAEVTCRLAERLDAPAVLSAYSRLLIDCNRAPGDPESIPLQSDGILIPGNQNLSDAEADWRLETFFWPYHHTITNTIAHLWRHGLAPAFISIHSFTPQLNGGPPRPWHMGILWNRDPRLALPILDWLRTQTGLCVGDNVPYSGREVGYTMETHAGAAGLPHVEFEIRQDLLADAAGWERWAQLVGDVLEVVLADKSIHSIVYF